MVLTQSNQNLKAKDEAPAFSLQDTAGKTYSLQDFTGKPILVIFMCNHCPYVKEKIDAIVKLQENFKDKINVVGINSNDPNFEGEGLENMKKFAEEYKINFPYLIDDTQKAARDYGAVCTPDPFLFNKEHKLVFHGSLDTMEENIKKLLNNEEIENSQKPSIGCSIKWKG